MQVGLDFGTTNSSIACLSGNGEVQLARFTHSGGATESYRSLLYLELISEASRKTIKSWSGPKAIERYLNADERGRLIQSLKSFLSSRGLQSTEVFGRRISLEDLVANILRDIRMEASACFGFPIVEAVVGRPVRFVGAENDEEDAYALSRLKKLCTAQALSE